ncbi:MAG: fructose bisphosphate aldolase [Gammaproteobacteria bacterium]|nr:fructose bisphosphate aldolase [Gammaproteobacteria bacterium]NKB64625.1 fructose bisphosphate aldolase [Gammaproteobacteria bacterium]
MSEQQLNKAKNSAGFIAALDQSGGSTPKALGLYGVPESSYSGEEEMYATVHAMRTRIMTNPQFTCNKILGAILFENTMDRTVEDLPTAQYLWEQKQILPFLKIDKGLADEQGGVQIMKPMPELNTLLEKANQNGIFGTKMRSVIKLATEAGIEAVVDQQFEIGKQVCAYGLVPIIEPEIDINSAEKEQSEYLLRDQLIKHLDSLSADQKVMLKLTLPENSNFYKDCISHSNVVRVVALSGGYSRQLANQKLSENNGMIASFSRALTEGLSVSQTESEFTTQLGNTIDEIVSASDT